MENPSEGAIKKDNLLLQIKTKKRGRFKAGAELSGAVNLIAVDFNETTEDCSESMELTIQIQQKFHPVETKC